jgi:hypothetical protein
MLIDNYMLRRVPEPRLGVGERVRQIFAPDCPTGILDAPGAIKNFLNSLNTALRQRFNFNAFDITEGFDDAGRVLQLGGYEHIGSVIGYRPAVGEFGHVVAYVKINDGWFLADSNAGYLIPRPIGPVCPNNARLEGTTGTILPDAVVFTLHIYASTSIPVDPSGVGAGSPIVAQEGHTCVTDTIHNILFLGNRVRRIFLIFLLMARDAGSAEVVWDRLNTYFGNKPEFRTLLEAITLMTGHQIEVSTHPAIILDPHVVDTTCTVLPRAGRGRRHRTRRRKLKVLTNRRKHLK